MPAGSVKVRVPLPLFVTGLAPTNRIVIKSALRLFLAAIRSGAELREHAITNSDRWRDRAAIQDHAAARTQHANGKECRRRRAACALRKGDDRNGIDDATAYRPPACRSVESNARVSGIGNLIRRLCPSLSGVTAVQRDE